MTLSNWIELAVFVVVVVVAIVVYRRIKAKSDDIEGLGGIHEQDDESGQPVGKA